MKKNYLKIPLAFCLALLTATSPSCKKLAELDETIDEAIEEMLGIKALTEELDETSSNFNNIEDIIINGKSVSATEVKMAFPSSIPYSFTKKRYSSSGSKWTITTTNYTGSFPKSLLTNKSLANNFKIIVQSNTPRITVNNVSAGSPGTGGGTGNPDTSIPTAPITLADKDVSGESYELKTFSFTVPSGVKSMTIRTTESTTAYRNTADLFVRKGSAPIVAGPKPPTNLPKYSWTADCEGIRPNREDEVCTFTNPGSGTWYVSLYGYNTYFSSRLLVTYTK